MLLDFSMFRVVQQIHLLDLLYNQISRFFSPQISEILSKFNARPQKNDVFLLLGYEFPEFCLACGISNGGCATLKELDHLLAEGVGIVMSGLL